MIKTYLFKGADFTNANLNIHLKDNENLMYNQLASVVITKLKCHSYHDQCLQPSPPYPENTKGVVGHWRREFRASHLCPHFWPESWSFSFDFKALLTNSNLVTLRNPSFYSTLLILQMGKLRSRQLQNDTETEPDPGLQIPVMVLGTLASQSNQGWVFLDWKTCGGPTCFESKEF